MFVLNLILKKRIDVLKKKINAKLVPILTDK